MKYIMMETAEGKKIPILFPDCIVHSEMEKAATFAIHRSLKQYSQAVSAGFVGIDGEFTTSGESESIGIKSKKVDAAYIAFGDAASLMPEAIVADLAVKAKKAKK